MNGAQNCSIEDVTIRGRRFHAGGRIYGLNMDHGTLVGAGGSIDPGFRQILIAGTGEQPLAFYQFDSEYCRAGPQTEITNSANVTVYGLKMEESHELMRIHDSSNIRIIGGSGNHAAAPDEAIFTLTGNCRDIVMVNLNRKGVDGGMWVRFGAQGVPDNHSLVMFKLQQRLLSPPSNRRPP